MIFKPDDIYKILSDQGFSTNPTGLRIVCEALERILLERSTVVYGWQWSDQKVWRWGSEMKKSKTHTARIFGVTEIEKKCAHYPVVTIDSRGININWICRYCEQELKPVEFELAK